MKDFSKRIKELDEWFASKNKSVTDLFSHKDSVEYIYNYTESYEWFDSFAEYDYMSKDATYLTQNTFNEIAVWLLFAFSVAPEKNCYPLKKIDNDSPLKCLYYIETTKDKLLKELEKGLSKTAIPNAVWKANEKDLGKMLKEYNLFYDFHNCGIENVKDLKNHIIEEYIWHRAFILAFAKRCLKSSAIDSEVQTKIVMRSEDSDIIRFEYITLGEKVQFRLFVKPIKEKKL